MTKVDQPEYGRNLRLRRIALKMSLVSLAEAAGIGAATVVRIEGGSVVPRGATVDAIERSMAAMELVKRAAGI